MLVFKYAKSYVLGLITMDAFRGVIDWEHWDAFKFTSLNTGVCLLHIEVLSSKKLKASSLKFYTANICLGCFVLSPISFEKYQPQYTKCF